MKARTIMRKRNGTPLFLAKQYFGSSECFRGGETVKVALPVRYAVSDQSRRSSLPLLEHKCRAANENVPCWKEGAVPAAHDSTLDEHRMPEAVAEG